MRVSFAIFGVLAAAITTLANPRPRPQGVTELVTPTGSPPPSCTDTRPGSFQITVINVPSSGEANKLKPKRDHAERDGVEVWKRQDSDGTLRVTLTDGILKDQLGRTGYIAANYQFQFDDPPQAGSIYTGGWSICSNGSLALGGSAIFYQCLSGSFYNLYDRHWAAQCSAIYIEAIGGAGVTLPSATVTPSSLNPATATSPPSSSPVTEPESTSSSSTISPTTTLTLPPSNTSAITGTAGSSSSAAASTTASISSSAAGNTMTPSSSGAASTTEGSAEAAPATSSENGGGEASASGSAPASSTGGAVPGAVSSQQGLFALAAGLFGAIFMV